MRSLEKIQIDIKNRYENTSKPRLTNQNITTIIEEKSLD